MISALVSLALIAGACIIALPVLVLALQCGFAAVFYPAAALLWVLCLPFKLLARWLPDIEYTERNLP